MKDILNQLLKSHLLQVIIILLLFLHNLLGQEVRIAKENRLSVNDTLEITIDLNNLINIGYTTNDIFNSQQEPRIILTLSTAEYKTLEIRDDLALINGHFEVQDLTVNQIERFNEVNGSLNLTLDQSDDELVFKYKSTKTIADLFNLKEGEFLQTISFEISYSQGINDLEELCNWSIIDNYIGMPTDGCQFNLILYDRIRGSFKEKMFLTGKTIKTNLNFLISEYTQDLIPQAEQDGEYPYDFQTFIVEPHFGDFDNDGKQDFISRFFSYYVGGVQEVLTVEQKAKLKSRWGLFTLKETVNDSLIYEIKSFYNQEGEGVDYSVIDLNGDGNLDVFGSPDPHHGLEENRPWEGDENMLPSTGFLNDGQGNFTGIQLNQNIKGSSLIQLDQEPDLEVLSGNFEVYKLNGNEFELISDFDSGFESMDGSKRTIDFGNHDLNKDGFLDLIVLSEESEFIEDNSNVTVEDMRKITLSAYLNDGFEINLSLENRIELAVFEVPSFQGFEGNPFDIISFKEGYDVLIMWLVRNGGFFGERVKGVPSNEIKAFKLDLNSTIDVTSTLFPMNSSVGFKFLGDVPKYRDIDNDGDMDIVHRFKPWMIGNDSRLIPLMINNGEHFEPRYYPHEMKYWFNFDIYDLNGDGISEFIYKDHLHDLKPLIINPEVNTDDQGTVYFEFLAYDRDNDGVSDKDDNAPDNYNPQQEDYDGDQIADVIDDDDDNDLVKDVNDECPNSQLGVAVDAAGCEVFALPTSTFSVSVTSATCPDSSNGSITISSSNTDYSYRYAIDDQAPQALTDNTQTISNLSAGIYTICVTVDGVADYQRCYTIEITEPVPLVASSRIDVSTRNLQLDLSGSEEYQVTLNGKTFLTSEDKLSLNLQPGMNRVEVATALDCQGVYFEEIFVSEEVKVYPNPTPGPLQLFVAGSDKEVTLSITSLSGSIIKKETLSVPANRIIETTLGNLPEGLYLITLNGTTVKTTHKVIKE